MKKVMVVQTWRMGASHALLDGISEFFETRKDTSIMTTEQNQLSFIAEWEIDGLITSINKKNIDRIGTCPFPVISTAGVPELNLPYVDADPDAIGVMAADYFLGLGHTQFAVAYKTMGSAHERRAAGFVNRLTAKGVRSVAEFSRKLGDLNDPECQERILAWIRSLKKPVALFCTYDFLGGTIISLLEEVGVFAPEDISVLGCEDDRIICEHVQPTLSSIRLPYKKIGYEAARLLDQLMRGQEPPESRILLPPDQVTVRMSTNTLATPDDQLRKAFGFIQKNATENISVEQIAQHAGMSVREMQRRFKASLGRSPKQELHLVRIDHVKRLLRGTDQTLSKIAEQSGFTSEYWMGSVFKTMTGRSPGAYRTKHRLR